MVAVGNNDINITGDLPGTLKTPPDSPAAFHHIDYQKKTDADFISLLLNLIKTMNCY